MRGQSRGLSNEWRLGRILRCQALQNSNREIVTLAVPALLTLAVDPLVSMVDTAFVAALGTVHLGALGVNTAIFFVAFFCRELFGLWNNSADLGSGGARTKGGSAKAVVRTSDCC